MNIQASPKEEGVAPINAGKTDTYTQDVPSHKELISKPT
jgi:hypothetical protein